MSTTVARKDEVSLHSIEEKALGPVWVINGTLKQANRSSEVLFTVYKQNGRDTDAVLVPATWVPIDLTGQVTRKQLVESSDFRRAVTQRKIILISEDHAAKLLAQDGAQEEIERIQRERDQVMSFSQQMAYSGSQTATVEDEEAGVRPVIVQLAATLEEEGEIATLNSLRSTGVLALADLRYMKKKAPANYTKLKDWLTQEIERVKSETADATEE